MTVRLNTLGRLQVFRGSEELASYSVRGTRCALLLYLAVEGETTRDAAMGLIWPESSPEKARHSLSQTLYELRKDLGEGWVESAGERLRAGDLESDARAFGEAVEAERFDDALALYHGPFLEGTYLVDSQEFQSWVDRRRSAIERTRRNVQRDEVERRLDRGDLDGALAMTYAWVECDPLDDEAQHRLIELLVREGRRSEALNQFEQFEQMLRRELEVTPLEETCRLIEQVRAGGEEAIGAPGTNALTANADSSQVVEEGPGGTALQRSKPESGVRKALEGSLAGEFDIVRKIGDGSMAEIYLAREVSLRRLVAIKVLRLEHADSETARRRFTREAQTAARVSDPNVATVFRTGVLENELPYLVMEWIKGTSLADRLASGAPLEEEGVRWIITGIARGLVAAHAKGVVHRDVRPENVLLEEDTGRVTLTDFGIAATLTTGDETPEHLTMSGELLSDLQYAAPEQLEGEGVTERTDVYSLGVIGFEMLTGEHPFGAASGAKLAVAKLNDEPRRVLDVRPEAHPGLAAIVDRCLNKAPDHRPRAVEVVGDLTGTGMSASKGLGEGFPPELGTLWTELRARRMPTVVGVFFVGSWLLLFGGSYLVARGVIGAIVYALVLVLVVSAFHAVLIRTWFHGRPGKHATSLLEWWMLAAVALVWIAVSLLVLVS